MGNSTWKFSDFIHNSAGAVYVTNIIEFDPFFGYIIIVIYKD